MFPKGHQIGNYRLVNRIGSGGMGDIYLAEDTRIPRKVAIKIMRTETDLYSDAAKAQEALRLFQREMRAITMLDHPNILPLYDFGEEQIDNTTITYMVMPFRAEGSLADWLQRRGSSSPLRPEEVAYIVKQAADALQHAHDRQLIHQDVKPSNFLVRNRAENSLPDVLLADFGIAKMNTATATASQDVRGTPAFMAPEQWDGQPGPATDQYALAIMAYLLLTGHTPFSGRMEQVMRHHFTTQPLPPSGSNKTIPPALDAVILRALQKEPAQRFPSISQFAQAFQQASSSNQMSSATPKEVAHPVGLPREPLTPLSPIVPASNPGLAADPGRAINYAASPTLISVADNTSAGKQKPRWKVLVSAALVIAVLSMSVIGLGIHQNQVNQQNASATASAHNATRTGDNDATATIQAQATASIQAQDSATVKANNPYPSYLAGHGTLALLDPLNKENVWHSGSNNTGGQCLFTTNGYQISEANITYFMHCDDGTAPSFSNFTFEVQMTITQGDCGGIIFREASDRIHFYLFQICQDGTYKVIRYYGRSGSDTYALHISSNSSIRTGFNQQNTIAVVATSTLLTFYVNRQQIDQEADSSYSDGKIGLIASPRYHHQTEVVYTNARVWTLQ